MAEIVDKVMGAILGVDAESRKELHRAVVERLKDLFVEDGYMVYLEYPIRFESRIRRSLDKVRREGKLDLAAVKNGLKIAIEFDTGVHVKFKSVEKLLEVDAEMCIAIVKGGANALESNVNRIKEVRKDLGCSKNNLWLMVLSEGKACKA